MSAATGVWSTAIPLLIGGILLGFALFGPTGSTDPELVLVVVLAPLVFGEALTSSIVDLRRVSRPVMALAVGLVVFGAVSVGFIAQWVVPGIWTPMAFALGAILGPTDAVAVSATRAKPDSLAGWSRCSRGRAWSTTGPP